MIDKNNPFDELKALFSFLLRIENKVSTHDERIPMGLRELYQIRDSYSIVKPNNTLFRNQDNLLLLPEISGDHYFDFLVENQSCWKCETEKGKSNPSVYIHDAESIDIIGRKLIHDSLNRFLTTYALQELIFELDFSMNSDFEIRDILSSNLKIEELWSNESYAWGDNNLYNFWLVEDSCLLMDCSITYFATDDRMKFDSINKTLKK